MKRMSRYTNRIISLTLSFIMAIGMLAAVGVVAAKAEGVVLPYSSGRVRSTYTTITVKKR